MIGIPTKPTTEEIVKRLDDHSGSTPVRPIEPPLTRKITRPAIGNDESWERILDHEYGGARPEDFTAQTTGVLTPADLSTISELEKRLVKAGELLAKEAIPDIYEIKYEILRNTSMRATYHEPAGQRPEIRIERTEFRPAPLMRVRPSQPIEVMLEPYTPIGEGAPQWTSLSDAWLDLDYLKRMQEAGENIPCSEDATFLKSVLVTSATHLKKDLKPEWEIDQFGDTGVQTVIEEPASSQQSKPVSDPALTAPRTTSKTMGYDVRQVTPPVFDIINSPPEEIPDEEAIKIFTPERLNVTRPAGRSAGDDSGLFQVELTDPGFHLDTGIQDFPKPLLSEKALEYIFVFANTDRDNTSLELRHVTGVGDYTVQLTCSFVRREHQTMTDGLFNYMAVQMDTQHGRSVPTPHAFALECVYLGAPKTKKSWLKVKLVPLELENCVEDVAYYKRGGIFVRSGSVLEVPQYIRSPAVVDQMRGHYKESRRTKTKLLFTALINYGNNLATIMDGKADKR